MASPPCSCPMTKSRTRSEAGRDRRSAIKGRCQCCSASIRGKKSSFRGRSFSRPNSASPPRTDPARLNRLAPLSHARTNPSTLDPPPLPRGDAVILPAAVGAYSLPELPIDAVPDITGKGVVGHDRVARAFPAGDGKADDAAAGDGAGRHPGLQLHLELFAERAVADHLLSSKTTSTSTSPAHRSTSGSARQGKPAAGHRAEDGRGHHRARRSVHVDRRLRSTPTARAATVRRRPTRLANRRLVPHSRRRTARRRSRNGSPTSAPCRTGSSARNCTR